MQITVQNSIMYTRVFYKALKVCIVLAVCGVLVQQIFLRDQKLPESDSTVVEEIHNNTDLTYEKMFPDYFNKPRFLKKNYVKDELYSDKIPKIVHQIWDTELVPQYYSTWIKTWKAVNPNWEHWFWTLKDARNLIKTKYSMFLTLYDSYISPIFQADVARYFIIHEYGGMYFDLDMKCLKPLDGWTNEYDCIVSEEPYEHSFVVREQNETNILNGFIACSKQHPFLQAAIDSLMEAARHHFGDYLRATGPIYFTEVYNSWLEKTKLNKDRNTLRVKVLPPQYFFPTYDKSESDTLSSKCNPRSLKKLPAKGQAVCRKLIFSSFVNEVSKEAFTDHDWLHAYMMGEGFKVNNVLNVTAMAPGVVLASKSMWM